MRVFLHELGPGILPVTASVLQYGYCLAGRDLEPRSDLGNVWDGGTQRGQDTSSTIIFSINRLFL